MPRNTEVVKLAQAAIEATPSAVDLARELGEQNYHEGPDGKFEVRAVDKNGAPDMKKARLMKEMFQDRNRIENKMAALAKEPPPVERKVSRGTIFMTGGWLPNAKERAEA